jgi:[lysine-biosynthesis-protein LysW]---L-2-aminoadipate ligase
MRVGLAYDVIRFEEKSLVNAASNLGYAVEPIHVTRSEFWLNEPNGPKADFIIQRCVSHSRALASTAFFERNNIFVVNRLSVLRDAADKLITSCLLAKAGVPTPATVVVFSREKALEAARKIGFPVVVKPVSGSWGRNLARAYDEQSLSDIIELRENMPNPQMRVHYIQEYVDKPERDIRAFYVWGDVPVAIYRVSKMEDQHSAGG